jgi:eukaryotic-like serine/threonine-protein kinase
LAAVHEQNLVHRDIKPTNIMVSLKEDQSVTAKIIDLGLVKTVDESASEAGISSPGPFVGTPEFASPEQFAGLAVDIRSDLYSLGVVLWEMCWTLRRKQNSEARRSKAKVRSRQPKFAQQWGTEDPMAVDKSARREFATADF